ncbi:hypothetical protein IU448_10910 [Nocardia flavorosea]|uniref:hypothetical protein n=1 Tax=Nocardia flavorosea TaxID=53429 RepID=UPI0018934781|nr:hypothetical protein [Nocardia flavorosea]MBF6349528.1 hypothetical protein [Nocardia flavorosea]
MSSSDGDSERVRFGDYWDPLTDGDLHGFMSGSGKDPVWNFFAEAGDRVESDGPLPDSLAYGGREALAPDRAPEPEPDTTPAVDAWSFSLPDRVAAEADGPAPGDLLIHPEHEDAALAWMIDNADAFLQRSLQLFGSGNGEDVPDFSAWLHNHGLVDSVNSSSMTDSYSAHITGLDIDKELFQGLEDEMTVTVAEVRQRSGAAVSYIDDRIAGLNEFLGYADDVVERVEVNPMDSPDGAPVGETVTTRRRVHPQYRAFLEEEILATITKVEDKIREVSAANEGSGVDGPEYETSDPGTPPASPDRPVMSYTPVDGSTPPGGAAGTPPAVSAGAPPAGAAEPAVTDDIGAPPDEALGEEVPVDGGTGAGSGGDVNEDAADSDTSGGRDAAEPGPPTGGMSSGDNGMGALSSMLPMMMMPMMMLPQMMAGMVPRDQGSTEGRGGENGERRRDGERERSAPAPAPEQAVSAPPAEPPPPADENGMAVRVTLPDGSSQQVPPAVAQAVNRELGNSEGSDARAAYAGTAGEPTAGHPWTAVDAGSVQTGDVAQWANRAGLLVVTDGEVRLIVDGVPLPFDPHDPPGGGIASYGEFQGYVHPSGVDLAGSAARVDMPV